MKKTILLIFFMVLSFLIADQLLYSSDKYLTGIEIIEMANKANQSNRGLVKKGVMELVNLETGKKESRKFIIFSKKTDDSERSMFRFLDSTYSGTTFLSIKKGNDSLMYIFLKSIGIPRQVEGSDKEATFVDTDITNEEMSGGITKDYEYKRIEDKKTGETECYVIERYPKLKNSRFSKHIVFIDKKTLKTILMKSYSKEDRVVKTIKQEKIKKITDNIYDVTETTVTDTEKKHATILKIDEIYEKDINAGYFSRERMGKKWAEE